MKRKPTEVVMSCPDCEAKAQELRQYKSAIESWKKDEVIWKQTERSLLLQAQQMQAGAEELLEENQQLREEKRIFAKGLELEEADCNARQEQIEKIEAERDALRLALDNARLCLADYSRRTMWGSDGDLDITKAQAIIRAALTQSPEPKEKV
jgi:regulator of replication initiation timing